MSARSKKVLDVEISQVQADLELDQTLWDSAAQTSSGYAVHVTRQSERKQFLKILKRIRSKLIRHKGKK